MAKVLKYTGKALENGDELLQLNPYIPSPSLIKAVNLTLYLKKRPLLLMGEPGVGKTCLAESVAYELLGAEKMKDYYFRWNIKSTSKAKDGLYRYDTFKRLADSQILKTDEERKQLGNLKLGEKESYVQPGYLSDAFRKSTSKLRSVILIDEIDKADIDFPNDLLNELDRMEFEVTELKIEEDAKNSKEKKSLIRAKFRPIVIITSNSEKELPDAFLRRCIFHYIDPLGEETLREIIEGRYYDGEKTEDELLTKSLGVILNLRSKIKAELLSLGKNISTSEYLDWFQALKHFKDLEKDTAEAKKVESLIAEVSKLDPENLSNIPFNHILLKNINSVLRFNEQRANP
jgi:MoxR-like ATPase